jgi:hypothetical protein
MISAIVVIGTHLLLLYLKKYNMIKIEVPISVGELFDKISILSIKKEKINDSHKLKNVIIEFDYLNKIAIDLDENYKENSNYIKLYEVNLLLWGVEESKRNCERQKRFEGEFIEISRQVHIQNDYRADIKKEINLHYNSEIIEEKSYEKY